MRIVLDTNIVVSYILTPHGSVDQLFQHWLTRRFEIVVSEPLLSEYKAVLLRPTIQELHNQSEAHIEIKIIQMFRKFAIVVDHGVSVSIIQDDPDDNLFIECAISGKANYIITGDAHLLNQKQYYGVQIFTARQFLGLLQNQAM
jgi:uncharacterized protein